MILKKTLVVICAIALTLTIATVVGATYTYQLMTSPHVEVDITVGSKAVLIPVTLTVNSTHPSDLDSLALTASITDVHASGMTVNFYDNETKIGSRVFDSNNVTLTLPAGQLQGGSHHSFYAGP